MSAWLASGHSGLGFGAPFDRPNQALAIVALLWSRSAPLFLLVPWLGLRVRPSLLLLVLSLGWTVALLPLALAAPPTVTASGLQLVSACAGELVRGSVLALGCALPWSVFAASGAVADGLRDPLQAVMSADAATPLDALYGRTALVLALAASAHLGLLRLFVDTLRENPLGMSLTAYDDVRGVLFGAARLVLRAFELGVALSAPVLLGTWLIALLLGLLTRVAGALLVPLGAGLWVWLGLAVVCLSVASVLDEVPSVVRLFTGETTRLLRELH